MIDGPSEHPNLIVKDPLKEVYKTDAHQEVEQSAIYANVYFHAIEENGLGIVLTSQCDITGNTDDNKVLLARVAPVLEIFGWWLFTKCDYTMDEIEGKVPIRQDMRKRKNVFNDFIENYLKNNTFQYYFIPKFNGKFGHSFICFDITECLSVDSLKETDKVCVLRSPFRETVPTRFSAYIGRIGTALFDDDYLFKLLDQDCKMIDP